MAEVRAISIPRFLDLTDQPGKVFERSKFRRDILMATTIDALPIVADGVGTPGPPAGM